MSQSSSVVNILRLRSTIARLGLSSSIARRWERTHARVMTSVTAALALTTGRAIPATASLSQPIVNPSAVRVYSVEFSAPTANPGAVRVYSVEFSAPS